ncbi:hypothetical protein [Microbacterium sp. NPDC055683]
MRTTRPLLLAASASALALGLTACSTTGGGGANELDWEDSPLYEYTNAGYGGDLSIEEQQAQADEQNREIEEKTAACMQEQGFEYIPNLDNGGVVYGEDDGVWDPESREWVEQYGYGIFNDPYAEQNAEMSEQGEEYVDPNADYVATLSESEQTAFYEVLYGESPSEEESMDPEFDWDAFYETADQGCYNTASNEVYGSDQWEDLYEQFQPLMDAMNELYTTTQESDAMVELDAEWAACMADADYAQYTKQAQPTEELYEQQNAFWEDQNAAMEEIDWETATEEEIEALSQSTDPSQSDEWKQAAEDEIPLALADLDCREATDYRDRALEIQFELEEQFIADNKAELEAYKAAAEQAS